MSGQKILLIDDDPAIRKFMLRALQLVGYRVFDAENGNQGLEQLRRVKPDLVILDMNMPGMNGLEFLKIMRNDNYTTTPVLLLSGTTDMDLITRSYDLGVYDFIKKPEHTEVMLKRVENGLKIGEMLAFNDLIRLELNMARKLQTYLFPPREIHGKGFALHGWSRPMADIGGDLYDWVHFRDERIIFFVADVSGHSISAALFTSIVKMIFRNAIKYTVEPDEIMTVMNRELSAHIPTESFVTMFCGILEPESRVLHYTNGGHPKPFIVTNNEKKILEGNNSFLGPIPSASFDGYKHTLEEGDRLVIFTDGILDRINLQNSQEARKELEAMITSGESAERIIERVDEYVQNEPEKIIDDCTLMLIDMTHG